MWAAVEAPHTGRFEEAGRLTDEARGAGPRAGEHNAPRSSPACSTSSREVHANDTLEDAVRALSSTEDSGLPVLAAGGRDIVGWLSHRDIPSTYHREREALSGGPRGLGGSPGRRTVPGPKAASPAVRFPGAASRFSWPLAPTPRYGVYLY
jgi:hypothetical protein